MMKLISIIFICIAATTAYGQTETVRKKFKIEIMSANNLEYDSSLQRITGNVILKQGSLTFSCDTAYLDEKTNSISAKGNAQIIKAGKIILSGTSFSYNANTGIVTIDNKEIKIDQD